LLSHSSPHRHPILARIDAKVLPPFDTESWKREMEVSDDDPFA
jgi:hypothetical protein